MGVLDFDASNACIPPACPLSASAPPLPTTVRGDPCVLDGKAGRLNGDKPLLLYGSGRLVVVRFLDLTSPKQAFVYRGHVAPVTCAKFSPSGAYVASADARGKLRVWSYDNEEHLCKLDLASALAGPIRGISWDFESKRICIVGESSKTDSSAANTKVIQWDTGVTCGDLGQHVRGRSTSCAFKPNRPMRIVTAGWNEDSRLLFNKGPPFTRVADGIPAEDAHEKGSAVNCVRYSTDGLAIASVSSDKSVCFYDGKTMALKHKMNLVHTGTIYACDWSSDNQHLITCSADGTVKLLSATEYTVLHTWNVAQDQSSFEIAGKVPMGVMQMGCAFLSNDVPVSVSLNGQISMLSVPTGLLGNNNGTLTETKLLTGHNAAIADMSIDEASGIMYTGDTDGIICSWDLSTGTALQRFQSTDVTMMHKLHTGTISALTFVNGKLLSTGWDDTIRITDGKDQHIQEVKVDAQPNAISHGTDLVVIMTVAGILLMKDGEIVSDMISLSYEALSICVSTDDSTVVVAGEDGSIHIYSVASDTLTEVHTIEGAHMRPIHSVSLSHDGTKLASADVKDICVWDVTNSWASLVNKGRWCFHTQRIKCLAWSLDDTILASGGNDDSIYLWNLDKKMRRVHYPFAHRGGVTGLQFIQGSGMILASVGVDACINQWDVTDDVAKKFA